MNQKMCAHKRECGKIVAHMPEVDKAVLKFTQHKRQLEVPFTIYADFECILEDIVNVSPSNSKTTTIKKHSACAFSYYIKCAFNNNLNKFKIYTGVDASKKFVELIVKDCKEIYNNYLGVKRAMDRLTSLEEADFQISSNCHICNGLLGSDRVRDHSHLTGKYRGAAHNECNLNYQVGKFIPIYFHNFSGYDCHLFIKDLAACEGDIKVIPLNKELYVSLSLHIKMDEKNGLEMRFLDSFRFMADSLDSLVNNLSENDFYTVRSHFSNVHQFKLMNRKGVFPYEYLTSFDVLKERQLPAIEKFFSTLNNKECTIEDYNHAIEVWNTFGCQNIGDYMELYLKADVLLLTDVFENFRGVCKNIYKLDPSHYFTAPGLSWDAMLKITKVELDLLTNLEMYNFCKKGIRGGIVQCSKRHTIANNKYLVDFDVNKPTEYLMYLDANNLYGWAMSQYLPKNNFEWVEDEEFDALSLQEIIENLADDSPVGYIYEVDLDYPEILHDLHNDLPFCAENKLVGGSKYTKLITDFSPKCFYPIHYRNLKHCLSHGLVLKKVHRILSFEQEPWLKKYIDINTEHRKKAKSTFEKNFFKLLNNAVYGKTMENVDKRKDVKITKLWETTNRNRLGAGALIAKPNFHSITTFSEDMVAIQLDRISTLYDKPIYLGFCVLELSKFKMYEFHYDFMQPKFQENLRLNYMDTDSFIYSLKKKDFYTEITETEINERFDTSEYPEGNQFNIKPTNKKVLGMMKDENFGNIMKEFVGLRPKMYAISVQHSKEIKKSKGVKKSVLSTYNLETFRDCLLNNKVYSGDMMTFRSIKHNIYTNKQHKITLSYRDDKRKIMPDGINTYAWGHYKIPSIESITNLSNENNRSNE